MQHFFKNIITTKQNGMEKGQIIVSQDLSAPYYIFFDK